MATMMMVMPASKNGIAGTRRSSRLISTSSGRHLMQLVAAMLVIVQCARYCMSVVKASDPDPLQDYCVADLSQRQLNVNGYPCKDAGNVTEEDFVFHGLARAATASASPLLAAGTLGFVEDFPGLNTLGLAIARLDFAVGGVIVPHTHPRASEIIFVLSGRLYCAFVDTSNKLFAKVLGPGDVMIFPRGLLHFQLNVGSGPATAVVALNSQQPGFQLVANSLFTPDIPNAVLRKTFFLDDATLDSIKATFQGTN